MPTCTMRSGRTPASITAGGPACNNGYIHLVDDRYEIRDAQFFAGELADEGLVDGQRIGAIGGSYGGGLSMQLAALKDRTMLPDGSRPLRNPLGGAPGFVLENVYVLPGLPAEMKAMYETIEDELRAERPIGSWRRTYRTTESGIAGVLVEAGRRYPAVRVGSYPSFDVSGGEVEVVLKSSDAETLDEAARWLERELTDAAS